MENRVTRILKAPEGSLLSRHASSLAAQILKIASDIDDAAANAASEGVKLGIVHMEESEDCDSSIHVSQGRFSWMDISVDKSNSPFHACIGGISTAPSPKNLNESSWYSLGDDKNPERDFNAQISALKRMLMRSLKSVKHQFDNSDCPQWLQSEYDRPDGKSHLDYLVTILEYLLNEFHYGYTQSDCGSLSFEIAFVNATVESITDVQRSLEEAEAGPNKDDIDPLHVDMLKKILVKCLVHAVDLVGVYVDSISYHGNEIIVSSSASHNIISEEAISYLSHIASNILRNVRHIITPPVRLAIPQNLKYKLLHSKSAFSKILEEVASPSMHLNSRNSWAPPEKALEEVSFLKAIRPGIAESYIKYYQKDASGSTATLESDSYRQMCSHRTGPTVLSEEDDILQWAYLLPYASFPRKIDIVVYVIRLQNKYYPL